MEITDELESYRYYLRAAVLVGVLAGAALGTLNLTWIAAWGYTRSMPQWDWWPALIQAHGNAQLYGWTGLFIIGIAGHSLPRMLQRPSPPAWLARMVFGLILGGLVLGLFAQPLSVRAAFAPLFPVSAALQWVGVTFFAVYTLRTIRRPREPWSGFVFMGTLWFWLSATARLWLSVASVSAGAATPPPAANAAYLHAMTWGFLVSYVLGYSLRLLPTFVGLPEAKWRPAWAMLALLTVGAVAGISARLGDRPGLSAVAMVVTFAGVIGAIYSLHLWAPVLSADDPEATWLARFVRTAYVWMVVAAVMQMGLAAAAARAPIALVYQHAFIGAARHALTVGFVSMMMIGVAWRILPIFSGAARPRPAAIAWVYGLLLTGSLLRVFGQVAAGLWGGAWYGIMGISGWLELVAVTIFAMDVLRLLNGTPEQAALPAAGAPVELSIDAPVGPLVAHRPWLIPVFARHGMGQVSNPLFQRTMGQRVTVEQACRRFNVEPGVFLRELGAADATDGVMR